MTTNVVGKDTPVYPTQDLRCPTCNEDLSKWFALIGCPCGQAIKGFSCTRLSNKFDEFTKRVDEIRSKLKCKCGASHPKYSSKAGPWQCKDCYEVEKLNEQD